jgi:hypothetical protein
MSLVGRAIEALAHGNALPTGTKQIDVMVDDAAIGVEPCCLL